VHYECRSFRHGNGRNLPGRWIWLLLVLATPGGWTGAQTPQAVTRFEINRVDLEGYKELSESDLRPQIVTRQKPDWLDRFLYSTISEKLGRKADRFNPTLLALDAGRLRTYYEHRGFAEVDVDTILSFSAADSTVDIVFRITEGYRSVIDTLTYTGIPPDASDLWEEIRRSPRIAVRDPFSLPLLEEEVKRVLRILNDRGYPNAFFMRDSSQAVRYASTRDYSVSLAFRMGKRCLFGDITIDQELDSLRGESRRTDITDDLILRYLDYKPGEFYSLSKRISSEGKLNRLGIFDLRQITLLVPPDSTASNIIPSLILIRPRDKHELAPEIIVSDDNNAFNLGVGLGYTSRNFMGDARILSLRARFRTQTLSKFPDYFKINSDAVSNMDLTLELLQPYLFSSLVQGSWSLSYIIDKQVPYLQNILRNKFGVTGRFAQYTTGYAEWTLDAVGLVKNDYYFSNPNDPATTQQLARLQDQQFNSIISFTIQRDKSNDLFIPSAGFIHSLTLEESGILGSVLQPFFPRLRVTQFFRANVLGRWYMDQTDSRFVILGLKARAGFAGKYGASKNDPERSIPQTHIFFGGGSGSVRGWQSRDLIAAGDPQLGGNIILEGSAELRINVLQSLRDGLLDRLWVVPFVDVGNVWVDVKRLQFGTTAIASGLGLRYDTLFGPFRIDWGFRVYDPTGSGPRWITQKQLIHETFRESVIHFGIGHAF
jgi:outer membrane protein assembly factor BamA